MGALIMTRGTKRLVAHYNDEFDTWIQFYRGAGIIDKFDRGGNNIDIWAGIVQNPSMVDANGPGTGHTANAGDPTLLPPPHPKHKNLHLRWQFFLQKVLTPENQNKLADAIYSALSDNNVKYIIFDVVHKTVQNVVIDQDDDDTESIARITIFTVPLRKHPKTHNGHDPDEIDT